MQSPAPTVAQYLAGLPDDRRATVDAVRAVILTNLPAGMVESTGWGMITYEVPLTEVPDTYNGQPLMYAALGSQKHHVSVYLSGIYASPRLRAWFEKEYRAAGLRVDLGKSCGRFRTLDELPLDLVGQAVAAQTLEEFVDVYQSARRRR
jgi:Domain of unknown function (DU1801)